MTETGHPLTIFALEDLFVRLNQRAFGTSKRISPSMLRDTCAVRYLRSGVHLDALPKMLGLSTITSAKRYQRAYEREEKGGPQRDV